MLFYLPREVLEKDPSPWETLWQLLMASSTAFTTSRNALPAVQPWHGCAVGCSAQALSVETLAAVKALWIRGTRHKYSHSVGVEPLVTSAVKGLITVCKQCAYLWAEETSTTSADLHQECRSSTLAQMRNIELRISRYTINVQLHLKYTRTAHLCNLFFLWLLLLWSLGNNSFYHGVLRS